MTLPFPGRPGRATRRPAGRPAAALLVPLLLFAAGCSGTPDDAAGPAAPTPSGRTAALCRTLHAALPAQVDGLSRRAQRPASVYAQSWGDPAVRLRCGVPRPPVLTPGDPHYRGTDVAYEVNGVEWMPEELHDGYRFTTVLREAFVEVTVPGRYAPEVNPLVDLAAAVRGSVPVGVV